MSENESDIIEMQKIQESILYFIELMWGIVPQPLKPEYVTRMKVGMLLDGKEWQAFAKTVKVSWFQPFVKGKHLSWQQWLILLSVEKAVQKKCEHKISVVSGHGVGKANHVDTIVPTPDGQRRWGDMQVGDTLFGADGTLTKITETRHFTDCPMYRVAFDDGSYSDVSSGHLWNVRGRQERRNNKQSWRTLETIEILDLGVKRSNGVSLARQWEIPIQGPAQFTEKNVAIHPYLVGVWLGDGTKGQPQYTKPYAEIAEKLRSFGYMVNENTDNVYRIQGVADLFSQGVFTEGSSERFIPDEYKYNTVENRMALFQGLCDTDGEVNSSGSIGYSTTSKQLADDVIWLARSLGCKAMLQGKVKKGWYKKDGKRVACKDCYRVTINAPFNPFSIPHRRERYKPSEHRYLSRWIESITPLPNADAMCVIVDAEDHLYLANDFIVTHNTATESWILLWYLYCHPLAQVPCTAPTSSQMYDILWKEVKIWLDRMPVEFSNQFEWTADHVRMKESPETWFARAKTASKENTEALAGVHGEWVCMLVDEGSGVEEAVFNTAAGALTNTEVLFVMISNGTRSVGYMYDSQHNNKHNFMCLQFNSEDSPLVDPRFAAEIIEKHGKDSDEYRIRVQGKFPKESAMDDKGYVQLLREEDLHEYEQLEEEDKLFVGHRTMGIDPSGEGKDKTSWAIRDRMKAKIVHREATSNGKTIASKTVTLTETYGIPVDNFANDVTVDAFGVGHDVGMEVALITQGKGRVYPVNTGDKCDLESDDALYENKRAEYYWKLRTWLRSGGSLVISGSVKADLLAIRYTRTLSGKIKIEPKKDLKKRGVKSPDDADALSLTFSRELQQNFQTPEQVNRIRAEAEKYDRHSIFGE